MEELINPKLSIDNFDKMYNDLVSEVNVLFNELMILKNQENAGEEFLNKHRKLTNDLALLNSLIVLNNCRVSG